MILFSNNGFSFTFGEISAFLYTKPNIKDNNSLK